MPLFKKASSLNLFWIIEKLNLVEENTFEEGKNFISVPLAVDLPK